MKKALQNQNKKNIQENEKSVTKSKQKKIYKK